MNKKYFIAFVILSIFLLSPAISHAEDTKVQIQGLLSGTQFVEVKVDDQRGSTHPVTWTDSKATVTLDIENNKLHEVTITADKKSATFTVPPAPVVAPVERVMQSVSLQAKKQNFVERFFSSIARFFGSIFQSKKDKQQSKIAAVESVIFSIPAPHFFPPSSNAFGLAYPVRKVGQKIQENKSLTFGKVKVYLTASEAGQVELSIQGNTNNQPDGNAVASATLSVPLTSVLTEYIFNLGASITQTANTPFWVVVESLSPGTFAAGAHSDVYLNGLKLECVAGVGGGCTWQNPGTVVGGIGGSGGATGPGDLPGGGFSGGTLGGTPEDVNLRLIGPGIVKYPKDKKF